MVDIALRRFKSGDCTLFTGSSDGKIYRIALYTIDHNGHRHSRAQCSVCRNRYVHLV